MHTREMKRRPMPFDFSKKRKCRMVKKVGGRSGVAAKTNWLVLYSKKIKGDGGQTEQPIPSGIISGQTHILLGSKMDPEPF